MEMNEYDLWYACLQDECGMQMMEVYKRVGSTETIFHMKKEELKAVKGISDKMADYIIYRRNKWDYRRIYDLMQREEIFFCPWYHEEYPLKLLQTPGHPFALFVKGELPIQNRPAVSIIGSRECSEYGRGMAKYFGEELGKAGVDVISGMAMGIDGIAQYAALKAGGKSYGVLGSGVEQCYPRGNYSLYSKLLEIGGVISEYGPGSSASAWHFPARNRIISALADVVLVIEARAKSGTGITVDMALDQGRPVMAVPGRISDPFSVGCNRLIRDRALIACDVQDVLLELGNCGYKVNNEPCRMQQNPEMPEKLALEKDENLVYSCLDLYSRDIESILSASKLPVGRLMNALMSLELKGYVKEVSKNSYVRICSVADSIRR